MDQPSPIRSFGGARFTVDGTTTDALSERHDGLWLVTTRGSSHVWDLDHRLYLREPGRGSTAGAMPHDGTFVHICRVDRYPKVGDRALVWADEPTAGPALVEFFRLCSMVLSIERLVRADGGSTHHREAPQVGGPGHHEVVMSHQQAKRTINEHLRRQGSENMAGPASRDRRWGVWVVADRDPANPDEVLFGGAYVLMDDGTVHEMSSAPGALDDLMTSLGASPTDADAWEREGESLTLLAELNLEEAKDLAANADERHHARLPKKG